MLRNLDDDVVIAPPFSPLDLSGLELWLDPVSLTSLGSLATWEDTSGNNRDGIILSGNTAPTVVSGRNGLLAVSFNGVADAFNCGDPLTDADDFTIFLVAIGNAGGGIIGRGFTTAHWDISFGPAGGNIVNTALTQSDVPASQPYVTAPGDAAADGFAMYDLMRTNSSGSLQFYVAGTLQSTVAGAAGDLRDTASEGFAVGKSATAHRAGTVGELLVFSSVLSGSDLTNMHTYLRNKWGVP